jgi:hypothetical protein
MWWECFDDTLHSNDGPVMGPVMALANGSAHQAVVGEGAWIVVLDTSSLTPSASYTQDPESPTGKFAGALTVAYGTLYLGDLIEESPPSYEGYFYIYQ